MKVYTFCNVREVNTCGVYCAAFVYRVFMNILRKLYGRISRYLVKGPGCQGLPAATSLIRVSNTGSLHKSILLICR